MRTAATVLVVLVVLLASVPAPPPELHDTVDIGLLTPAEASTFQDILGAVEAGKDSVAYHAPVDHYKLLTHLGLHYGHMAGVSKLYGWNDSRIVLNLDQFRLFEDYKRAMGAKVDELLRGIQGGTDRALLRQCARRVAHDLKYQDGVVVCSDYAMLFYKLATRLGIQTYIAYGYSEGVYHAWNVVELDGRLYHYDVTYYDNRLRLPGFLHSAGWGRTFTLNNLWEV